MRLYGDGGTTLRLLEDGQYLPAEDGLTRLDSVLSKALTDLLHITSTIAYGYDINKRNYGAIEAHVEVVPLARSLYPDWVFRN